MITYEKITKGGVDMWIATDEENDLKYMVYKDPNEPVKIDMSNVDLSTMTQEQLEQLKTLLGI